MLETISNGHCLPCFTFLLLVLSMYCKQVHLLLIFHPEFSIDQPEALDTIFKRFVQILKNHHVI